jgi:AraC-like DNA-binding protein
MMELMDREQSSREAHWVQTRRDELVERVARAIREDGTDEPLAGLRLRRVSSPTELGHGTSYPSFCVVAQGSKEVRLGDRRFRYDPAHFLVATAALPVASRITEASKERPFLNLLLRLDPALVGSVMVEAGRPAPRGHSAATAIDVSLLDADLLDAVVRLVRLLDSPADALFLAPLIKREIVYRLFRGDQGDRVRHIATLGGGTNRIVEAIDRLRKDFDRSLRIEDLARDLGMSVSGFHHHFKEVTAMSPLQFQKQLRLQEARRLMLGEDFDAASAGYRVGYDDASHFSREYKRLFGAPPMRDVERLGGPSRRVPDSEPFGGAGFPTAWQVHEVTVDVGVLPSSPLSDPRASGCSHMKMAKRGPWWLKQQPPFRRNTYWKRKKSLLASCSTCCASQASAPMKRARPMSPEPPSGWSTA